MSVFNGFREISQVYVHKFVHVSCLICLQKHMSFKDTQGHQNCCYLTGPTHHTCCYWLAVTSPPCTVSEIWPICSVRDQKNRWLVTNLHYHRGWCEPWTTVVWQWCGVLVKVTERRVEMPTVWRVWLVEANVDSEDWQHRLVKSWHAQLSSVTWIGKLKHKHDVVGSDVVLGVIRRIKEFLEWLNTFTVATARPCVEPLGGIVTTITTVIACQQLNIVRCRSWHRHRHRPVFTERLIDWLTDMPTTDHAVPTTCIKTCAVAQKNIVTFLGLKRFRKHTHNFKDQRNQVKNFQLVRLIAKQILTAVL